MSEWGGGALCVVEGGGFVCRCVVYMFIEVVVDLVLVAVTMMLLLLVMMKMMHLTFPRWR